jgi:hypothetical protein
MPTIEELVADLTSLKAFVQQGVDNAMVGSEQYIPDINRSQLRAGFDANGEELGSYAESTKVSRKRKGLQTDYIDLNYTGKSQEGLNVSKVDDSKFELTTNPNWDEQRFPDAIGIMNDNEDLVTEAIVENIEVILNEKFL